MEVIGLIEDYRTIYHRMPFAAQDFGNQYLKTLKSSPLNGWMSIAFRPMLMQFL